MVPISPEDCRATFTLQRDAVRQYRLDRRWDGTGLRKLAMYCGETGTHHEDESLGFSEEDGLLGISRR